jgi:hypothetical protein
MLLIPRPLLDPPPQDVDFGIRQPLTFEIRRRHAAREIGGGNSPVHFAAGKISAGKRGAGALLPIEPERTLAAGGVRTVAGEAPVGENRTYVAVEFDGRSGSMGCYGKSYCGNKVREPRHERRSRPV